jgi:hypothetical protein
MAPLMMLKMAVLAPIPKASVINVATVNIGVRVRRRPACRTSRITSNIEVPPDVNTTAWQRIRSTVALAARRGARVVVGSGRGDTRCELNGLARRKRGPGRVRLQHHQRRPPLQTFMRLARGARTAAGRPVPQRSRKG